MGIPFYFNKLEGAFHCLETVKTRWPVNHLFLDMNNLLWMAVDKKDESSLFKTIRRSIMQILRVVNPTDSVFFMLDGAGIYNMICEIINI